MPWCRVGWMFRGIKIDKLLTLNTKKQYKQKTLAMVPLSPSNQSCHCIPCCVGLLRKLLSGTVSLLLRVIEVLLTGVRVWLNRWESLIHRGTTEWMSVGVWHDPISWPRFSRPYWPANESFAFIRACSILGRRSQTHRPGHLILADVKSPNYFWSSWSCYIYIYIFRVMGLFLKIPLVGLCFFTMKPSSVNHYDARAMLKRKKERNPIYHTSLLMASFLHNRGWAAIAERY